jgi:D-alanyl-D-alanine carboxypeptidase/D-alanyl-D-alanine-endopeptidase (penicillin-binding protein 4)
LLRFVLLFCLLARSSFGADLPGPIAAALAASGVPESAAGIFVQRVGEATPLLVHEADAAMNPASVMKLLTTYAGLEILGPAFTWKTEAYVDGPVKKGVLRGNLVIKGYGDPQLTVERFWLLLKRIRAAGVREIRADVLLDSSYFSLPDYDPGSFDAQPMRAYNAGPSALLLNFNAVDINLSADDAGQRVLASVEPGFAALRLSNRLKLDADPCGDWRERLGLRLSGTPRHQHLILDGRFSAHCGAKTFPLSLFSSEDFLRAIFLDLWAEMGGSLRGRVLPGSAPQGARLIARLDSPALSDVIRDINKFSNNVMARQLYLTLGTATEGAPATLEKAGQAVSRWLRDKRLEFPELVIENGSGLSRRERISARHLAELLIAAWQSPVMAELVSSLPIVAIDGTMKKRLRDQGIAGRAHIKTGSLDGVKTLAGYVLDSRGRTTVVVALINHSAADGAEDIENTLLQWVYSGAG